MSDKPDNSDWTARHVRLRVQLLLASGLFFVAASGATPRFPEWFFDQTMSREHLLLLLFVLAAYYFFHYLARTWTEMSRIATLSDSAQFIIGHLQDRIDNLDAQQREIDSGHVLGRLEAWEALEKMDLQKICKPLSQALDAERLQLKETSAQFSRLIDNLNSNLPPELHRNWPVEFENRLGGATPVREFYGLLQQAIEEARAELKKLQSFPYDDYQSGFREALRGIEKHSEELKALTREWTGVKNIMSLERFWLSCVLPGVIGLTLIVWGVLAYFNVVSGLPLVTLSNGS